MSDEMECMNAEDFAWTIKLLRREAMENTIEIHRLRTAIKEALDVWGVGKPVIIKEEGFRTMEGLIEFLDAQAGASKILRKVLERL